MTVKELRELLNKLEKEHEPYIEHYGEFENTKVYIDHNDGFGCYDANYYYDETLGLILEK